MPRTRKANAPDLKELNEKLPPHDGLAELSVLGSCLLDNDKVDELSSIVQGRHFYSDANRMVWYAIQDMNASGKKCDAVTVGHELQKRGQLADIGGGNYLIKIMETVPHTEFAEHYAAIVRDQWIRRSLIEHGTNTLQAAHTSLEISEALTEIEADLFKIAERNQSHKSMAEVGDVLKDAFDAIMKRMDSDGGLSGIPTGFIDVDNITGGLSEGLIILAARPSMGKTAFVCNMCLNMAKAGHAVLFISLEQSRTELCERMLCSMSRIDTMALKRGVVTQDDQVQMKGAVDQLMTFPIIIDDDERSASIDAIAAQARRAKRKWGIDCVVIDYLQLIKADQRIENREQQVASISRRLKFISKELGIPVVALAQLNRGVELRPEKRPRLSDLRESGSIEQDADVVAFLFREEVYDPKPGENEGLAELIIAKQRNGMIGTAKLTWMKESVRFENYSPKTLFEV